MAENSKIEWTDATWTPIRARLFEIQEDGSGKESIGWHCEHVSDGCRNCYAERINQRLGTGLDYKPGELWRAEKVGYSNGEAKLFLDEKMLLAPLRWKKPRMIFVCSMTDLFADFVPDEWIDKIFAVMALSPQHTFQVLTKRAARMRTYFRGDVQGRLVKSTRGKNPNVSVSTKNSYHSTTKLGGEWPWPLPNVWLGVSTERQQEADERIPELLRTPAAVRFVSAEPLLGAIDLIGTMCRFQDDPIARRQCAVPLGRQLIDWVITGGESGPHARPSNPQWYRDIRDQCAPAGIAYFHKQNGEWVSVSEVEGDGEHFHFPDGRTVRRIGKAKAGRKLDGVTHDAMPERPA